MTSGEIPLPRAWICSRSVTDRADRCLDFKSGVFGAGLREESDSRREMGLGRGEVVGAGAGQTLNEDALGAVRELHRAHDGADATDLIEVVLTRIAHLGVALCEQEDRPVGGERLVHRHG